MVVDGIPQNRYDASEDNVIDYNEVPEDLLNMFFELLRKSKAGFENVLNKQWAKEKYLKYLFNERNFLVKIAHITYKDYFLKASEYHLERLRAENQKLYQSILESDKMLIELANKKLYDKI